MYEIQLCLAILQLHRYHNDMVKILYAKLLMKLSFLCLNNTVQVQMLHDVKCNIEIYALKLKC